MGMEKREIVPSLVFSCLSLGFLSFDFLKVLHRFREVISKRANIVCWQNL